MAIYIDPPLWPAHGTLWSHLVSDTSYAELHAFAARAGFPRRSFDLDHYDVPASQHDLAVSLGALAVSTRDVVHRLQYSGLRIKHAHREAMRPVAQLEYLNEQWAKVYRHLTGEPGNEGLSAHGAWQALGQELLGRWAEPHRKYHALSHLEDVLLSLNLLEIRGETIAPVTLLAAWFHDAIYTGNAARDESESAALAVTCLTAVGVSPMLADQVGEFIVATTPGVSGGEVPRQLAHLIDSDLAIFGASAKRYGNYAVAVRAEYAHVPDADFRSGRAQILRAYLDRAPIYRTRAAQEMWEERARINLAAEINALESAPAVEPLAEPA